MKTLKSIGNLFLTVLQGIAMVILTILLVIVSGLRTGLIWALNKVTPNPPTSNQVSINQ